MNFKTIQNMTFDIFNSLNQIPREVDLIVGVPRSGMLAASIIALYLNLPLTDIDSFVKGQIYEAGDTKHNDSWISSVDEARKVLVVEDSINTGRSIKKVRTKLTKELLEKSVFYAVYVTKQGKDFVDIFVKICEQPRMFEWNCFHHQRVNEVCFDIDGVLCRDPSNEENDDGEKYLEFISTVDPIVIPTFTIGCIITSRLEKYREATDKWLKENGIKYNKMIMMQYATREDRLRAGNHGVFKGQEYKKQHRMSLFVESNAKQAEEISNISGKGVFCTENHMYYEENKVTKVKKETKKVFSKLVPANVKKMIKGIIKS